ncbi:MAG: FGGY-family carbohydrate kinase, partial [Candidatus Nanopelagicales bacterium]|nr:FGGY-family carbohydrate kinase [Candidatus Nanopelagicales bacterium]
LLYDLHTGQWSHELCELFGIPMNSLPEVVSSYGHLSRTDPRAFAGIDAPITGIAGDQQAALVGQACFTAGTAKCTYGTGSFLLMHTGDRPVMSSGGLLTTVALAHPDGRRDFALEGAVFVTGAAIQWLRDGLGIIAGPDEVEALAASVPDTGGVVFVPALTGLGAPAWDPSARGMIIGITRGTTRAHVARATLEAIAYQVRDVADLMVTDAGMPIDQLAIDGGAAINNLLCQMQADALQSPVNRSAELQTTGLGAAFLAGLGAGLWESTTELASTCASSGVFTPATCDTDALRRWHDAVQRSLQWADA